MRIRRRSFEHAFSAALEEAARDGGEAVPEARAGLLSEGDAALLRALEGLAETPEDVPAPAPPSAAYHDELVAREAFGPAAGEGDAPPVGAPDGPPLRPGLGAEELRRARRRLALANHPDRVPPEQREAASQAMAEINAAIDHALKAEKKTRHR